MDDCYAGGRGKDVLAAGQVWVRNTMANGGQPNFAKCKIYFNHPDLEAEAKDIADKLGFQLVSDGLMVAGIPVGSKEFQREQLADIVQRHSRLFSQLELMDPQTAQLITRYSAVPSLVHATRTVPENVLRPHAEAFDRRVLSVVQSILGVQDNEIDPLELQLPGNRGGSGFRATTTYAAAANVASLDLVLPLLRTFDPTLEALAHRFTDLHLPDDTPFATNDDVATIIQSDQHPVLRWMCEAWLSLRAAGVDSTLLPGDPRLLLTGYYQREAERRSKAEENPAPFKIQKRLTAEIEGVLSVRHHGQSVSSADRARNLSKSDSSASAFLHTLPRKQSLMMSPHEWQVASALRHGWLHDDGSCACGALLTPAHMVSCRHLRARITRHDWLVQDVVDFLHSLGIWAQKEVIISSEGKWRVDIVTRIDGVMHWCDVMVTEPSSATYLNLGSADRPAVALVEGQKKKLRHWLPKAGRGIVIVPLVMETSGRLGNRFKDFLSKVVDSANARRKATGSLSQPYSSVSSIVRQLSITVQKGNVAMVDEACRRARVHSVAWRSRCRARRPVGRGY